MTYAKLIERVRVYEQDHAPDGWPAIKMRDVSTLADAIEALQSECAEHKENAMRNARQAVAFRAARDQLQAENERIAHANNALKLAVSGLQAKLDAMGKGEAVQFLCDATRFKVRQHEGDEAGRIYGLPSELNGRWVALVAADDDCHLKLAAPKALAPLTQQQRMAVWNDVKSEGYGRWEFSFADVVDAVEKAHGIGGTP